MPGLGSSVVLLGRTRRRRQRATPLTEERDERDNEFTGVIDKVTVELNDARHPGSVFIRERRFAHNQSDFVPLDESWCQLGAKTTPAPRNNGDDPHRFFESFVLVSVGWCSLVLT